MVFGECGFMWVYVWFIPIFWGTICFSFWGGMLGDSLEVLFQELFDYLGNQFVRKRRTDAEI